MEQVHSAHYPCNIEKTDYVWKECQFKYYANIEMSENVHLADGALFTVIG